MVEQQVIFQSDNIQCKDNRLDLQLYIDWSSAELFAAEGVAVFSVRIFTDEMNDRVSVTGNGVHFERFECHSLRSIWTTTS